jgi:hypothetical protein
MKKSKIALKARLTEREHLKQLLKDVVVNEKRDREPSGQYIFRKQHDGGLFRQIHYQLKA